jgi:hypothetical protein
MIETLLIMLFTVAPGCIAIDSETMRWGEVNQALVTIGPVPAGRAWLVRAAGGFTTNRYGAEYMMAIHRPVRSQKDACCWLVPVARSAPGTIYGTPVIALNNPLVLHEGEKLDVRMNGQLDGKIGINAVYYDLPRSCLPIQ